jgi:PAS domain S-box-containing protein
MTPKRAGAGGVGRAVQMQVVCSQENEARRLESHLRNAGHNVRVRWAGNLDQLEVYLKGGAPDLILSAEGIDPARVTELSLAAYPEVPVIWIGEQPSPEVLAEAMAKGARDVCAAGSPAELAHFERVFVRETSAAESRRELAGLRSRLAASESHSQQLLSAMPEALAYVQEGILTRVNPAFAKLIGEDDVETVHGHPLMDHVASDHRTAIRQHLKHIALGQMENESVTFALSDREGKPVEVRSRWKRATLNGEPVIELTLRRDVDRRAPTPQSVVASGPPTRNAFLKALAGAGDKPAKAQRLLMFMVVDGFPSMEERLGLQSAEEAVLELFEFVNKRLSGAAAICRFSSDEIAALLDCPANSDIDALITGLCRDIAAEVFQTSFHQAHLTVTVLGFPLGQETVDSAMHDVCREARKLSKQGGNRASLLGAAAKTSLVDRELARRAAQVKQALENNRLRLAYQAIASLEGETRQHQDVLVRMLDENGQEVVAADFIAAAEKHGLIRAIDRWVVSQIVQMIVERKPGADVPSMFVRVSEETLRFGDEFLTWLGTRLERRPLKPDELVFELQESVLQNHITKAKDFCAALRKLGAEVAIGHFGSGPHADRLLDSIPARYVKFHPQFTQRFGDPAMQKRLNQLLGVLKPKNIKTICSHIEDANLMAKLWQLGINFIQGRRVQEPEVLKLTA